MRWLILLPAVPGALIGGWLGEHFGLRVTLGFAGVSSLLLALVAWRLPIIRSIRTLPTLEAEDVVLVKQGVGVQREALDDGTSDNGTEGDRETTDRAPGTESEAALGGRHEHDDSRSLGIIERCLELCVDYAKERVQFGKPIGEFQLIQDKLARMEVARLNVQNLVFRTIYTTLGINADHENMSRIGRPIKIVDGGNPFSVSTAS